MSAIEDIASERARQIQVEGWSPEHDDKHDDGDLAAAAISYALQAKGGRYDHETARIPPSFWPWSAGWWKPKNPRRDLIRAGALIIAEIERLDRAALEKNP